jgi:hypothetical protein
MAVLAWQGGGSVGAGRLATVGASPWLSGAVVAGEIAVVGSAALGVSALAGWWRARSAPPVLRRVVDVELPAALTGTSVASGMDDTDDELTERLPGARDHIDTVGDDETSGADVTDDQVTERIDAPNLVVVKRVDPADGGEAGKLAG